jgi:hypothetical protein
MVLCLYQLMLLHGCHTIPSSGRVYIFQRVLGQREGGGGRRGRGWGKRSQILLQSLVAMSLLEALVKNQTKTSADVVSFLQLNISMHSTQSKQNNFDVNSIAKAPPHHFTGSKVGWSRNSIFFISRNTK